MFSHSPQLQEVWKHSLSTLLNKNSFVLALSNLLLARCTFYSLIYSIPEMHHYYNTKSRGRSGVQSTGNLEDEDDG